MGWRRVGWHVGATSSPVSCEQAGTLLGRCRTWISSHIRSRPCGAPSTVNVPATEDGSLQVECTGNTVVHVLGGGLVVVHASAGLLVPKHCWGHLVGSLARYPPYHILNHQNDVGFHRPHERGLVHANRQHAASGRSRVTRAFECGSDAWDSPFPPVRHAHKVCPRADSRTPRAHTQRSPCGHMGGEWARVCETARQSAQRVCPVC